MNRPTQQSTKMTRRLLYLTRTKQSACSVRGRSRRCRGTKQSTTALSRRRGSSGGWCWSWCCTERECHDCFLLRLFVDVWYLSIYIHRDAYLKCCKYTKVHQKYFSMWNKGNFHPENSNFRIFGLNGYSKGRLM